MFKTNVQINEVLPTHIPAALWDKMMYLARGAHDRMIRTLFRYETAPDADILRKALLCLIESEPLLHSAFIPQSVEPFWAPQPYREEDVLTVLDASGSEAAEQTATEFILQELPIGGPLQIKSVLVRDGTGGAFFGFVVCHMLMDGGDTGELLRYLGRAYNAILAGETPVGLPTGDRSMKPVYAGMKPIQRIVGRLLFPYKIVDAVYAVSKDHILLPFCPDQPEDRPYLVRRTTSPEAFQELKDAAKQYHCTINDLLIAAYMHAMYEVADYPSYRKSVTQCPVNLRRYVPAGYARGLSNLTSTMLIGIPHKGRNVWDTLRMVRHGTRAAKASPYFALYGLPSVQFMISAVPFGLLKKFFPSEGRKMMPELTNVGILPADEMTLGGARPVDGFATGTVKHKPNHFVAVTTLDNKISFVTNCKGSAQDRVLAETLLEVMGQHLIELIEKK